MRNTKLLVCLFFFLFLQSFASFTEKREIQLADNKDSRKVDSTTKVTLQTIMNSRTLDEWLLYATKYPNTLAKGDKTKIEFKIKELCISFPQLSQLVNSNPSYVSKKSLEVMGMELVKSMNDIPGFVALFPLSQLVDSYIESKVKVLNREEKLLAIGTVPKSPSVAIFKRELIDNVKTLNECIELVKVCGDCRDELAGKCFGQLVNSNDYRRFLNYFGNTKYGTQITTIYNEMISKRAENLGENINTEYPDFGPVISPDGSTMYFSRNYTPNGYGGEDIYVSKIDSFGEWSKAENIRNPLNNSEHNGVYSVSQDGQELFLHNDYEESSNNPSITIFDGRGWAFPATQQIPNLKSKGKYHNGSLSIDGKYLLMSVKRDDSYGGRFLFWKSGGNDIYVMTKDTNGNWSEPKNLGSVINTEEEEGSVFLAADGQTIYFSSAGHSGYGEQDMFMSRRLDDTWTNWTTPLNLGRTINSSGQDDFYVIPAKGDFIYFSSDRDGYGKDDIFRIGLPMEMRPKPVAVIKGIVINKKDNAPVLAKVNYEDLETGIQLGSVTTNPASGEYQIILVSGRKYGITPIPITVMNMETTIGSDAKASSGESFENGSMNKERIGKENSSGKSGDTNIFNNTNIINSTTVFQNNVAVEGKLDNNSKGSNTNKNYPKLFAESQNIDLTDLKEYTVIEQKLVVVPVESGQTISLNNLFFETATWVLKKESSLELNRVVKILSENPLVNIEIGGHTDDKGSDETNKALSEKRAFEVYSYLITKSISKERLIYVGYGESKPKVPNTTESNRAINRRVELKIR